MIRRFIDAFDVFFYRLLQESNSKRKGQLFEEHLVDWIFTKEYYDLLHLTQDGSNMGAYGIGCDPIILSISSELLPVTYILHQNYPNPFNPITTLRYDLPENGLVNITIYDMLGKQVKTLINQTQDAGYRSVIWDATNDYGKPVSAGIYLYQIQAGKYLHTKKMVLLK